MQLTTLQDITFIFIAFSSPLIIHFTKIVEIHYFSGILMKEISSSIAGINQHRKIL